MQKITLAKQRWKFSAVINETEKFAFEPDVVYIFMTVRRFGLFIYVKTYLKENI